MAEILFPVSPQFVVIEPGTCQLHNLSRLNILLIHIMIRQDHFMGRPRNVVSTYICSIGTIRGGIPPGAPNHKTISWNEDLVITDPVSIPETLPGETNSWV
jgi:hypothetical protein